MSIKAFQEAYYNGKPLITDEQYDQLVLLLGEDDIGPTGDTDHLNPMYSLDKLYPCRGDIVPSTVGYVHTQKFDGAAIELVYKRMAEDYFVLEHMCTRGNVDRGKLLDKRKHNALGIPTWVVNPHAKGVDKFQVTGEVVSTTDIPNARNMVSGKLNTKDIYEYRIGVEELGLKFIAYNIVLASTKPMLNLYTEDLEFLGLVGFLTVLTAVEKLSTKPMVKLNFDGDVYRINNNAEYYRLGFTAKTPRGAFAVKEDAEFHVTTLLDVEWNVGRTGKVVPTAILEPIMIEGATVSRATLNNPQFIKLMGLYKGCKVKIIRSGEIIPCIIGLDE